MRTFYKVLGIATTADEPRIKSAFRRRAKAVHPDLNPGRARAEERFNELMQAYNVLRDAEARAAYDAHLAHRRREARHRFAQSAAVMMVTFVLTTVAGSVAMGLPGIGARSQAWQRATAWLTSVEIEAPLPVTRATEVVADNVPIASGAGSAAPPAGRHRLHRVTEVRPTRPSAPPAVWARNLETAARTPDKAQNNVAAAEPRPSPAASHTARSSTSSQDGWWPWPASDEQPYYGLGASDLR